MKGYDYMKKFKIMISILIFFTIILSINTISKASNGFDAFNKAPQITFSTSSNKFDDITILITDNSGINLSYLRIVEVTSSNTPKAIDSKYLSKSVVTKSGSLVTRYLY